MQTEAIKVSYRDKTSGQNVSLGTVDAPRFATVAEAVEYFESVEAGKGEELALEYLHTAHDIELQRKHRDANRPDKPKTTSNVSKFKQLSLDKQEEILREHGLL
jgi:hypothetical protein